MKKMKTQSILSEQKAPLRTYKGSIILSVDDHVYVTKDPKKVLSLLEKIEKKHHKKPLITVMPTEDTLIV